MRLFRSQQSLHLYKLNSQKATQSFALSLSWVHQVILLFRTCYPKLIWFKQQSLVDTALTRNKKQIAPGLTLSPRKLMEISSQYGPESSSSRDKRRLSKAERTRRSREMFWRKGSKILPDFFPPDTHKRKTYYHQTALAFKGTKLVKQYSWEKEENGQFEAQTIAQSWMMYFGLEACEA